MKTRTQFTHRLDTWDDASQIIEHLAGIEDFEVAEATYRAAVKRWPKAVIILRQGARVIHDSREANQGRIVMSQEDALALIDYIEALRHWADEVAVLSELDEAGYSREEINSACRALGRSAGQDFAFNLSAKRRLCNTVGGRIGRIVEGCAAYRFAVTAARSRAATMTNFARSSLALVLRAFFGGAKSCALVSLFMICPRWSAGG